MTTFFFGLSKCACRKLPSHPMRARSVDPIWQSTASVAKAGSGVGNYGPTPSASNAKSHGAIASQVASTGGCNPRAQQSWDGKKYSAVVCHSQSTDCFLSCYSYMVLNLMQHQVLYCLVVHAVMVCFCIVHELLSAPSAYIEFVMQLDLMFSSDH